MIMPALSVQRSTGLKEGRFSVNAVRWNVQQKRCALSMMHNTASMHHSDADAPCTGMWLSCMQHRSRRQITLAALP